MTPEQIAEEIFAGAERMQVDLKSTLDLTDEVFDALKDLVKEVSA